MRDYFAYWWAVVRDLFNRERVPFEDLIEEPPIFRTEEADRG